MLVLVFVVSVDIVNQSARRGAAADRTGSTKDPRSNVRHRFFIVDMATANKDQKAKVGLLDSTADSELINGNSLVPCAPSSRAPPPEPWRSVKDIPPCITVLS